MAACTSHRRTLFTYPLPSARAPAPPRPPARPPARPPRSIPAQRGPALAPGPYCIHGSQQRWPSSKNGSVADHDATANLPIDEVRGVCDTARSPGDPFPLHALVPSPLPRRLRPRVSSLPRRQSQGTACTNAHASKRRSSHVTHQCAPTGWLALLRTRPRRCNAHALPGLSKVCLAFGDGAAG